MDMQQQIFGLYGVAQDQQKAVQEALDSLAAEREKLAQMSAKLERGVPTLQKATETAVKTAMAVALQGAAQAAVKAFEGASGALIKNLAGAAEAAQKAESELNEAISSFRWKWAALAAAMTLGGIVAVLCAAWLVMTWNRAEIASLSEQRQALLAEVAGLQRNLAELEKRGGKITMNNCGGRLCIEASRNQGDGWQTSDGRNVRLVIPNGY